MKYNPSPPILMDPREPTTYQEALHDLARQHGYTTTREALTCGDYRWTRPDGARVVVERKTLSDLIASVRDGRWQEQCSNLVGFEYPILLLEGTYLARSDGSIMSKGDSIHGWTWDGLENLLCVAQLRGLCISSTADGPRSVARRLLSLYEFTLKDHHGSTVPPKPRVLTLDPTELSAVAMLMCLPTVGEKTARKLLDQTGSVHQVVNRVVSTAETEKEQRWRNILVWTPTQSKIA